MLYHPLGDLQQYLWRPLPEPEARCIAEQVLEGLRHMHKNGFAHRDLKPKVVPPPSSYKPLLTRLAEHPSRFPGTRLADTDNRLRHHQEDTRRPDGPSHHGAGHERLYGARDDHLHP